MRTRWSSSALALCVSCLSGALWGCDDGGGGDTLDAAPPPAPDMTPPPPPPPDLTGFYRACVHRTGGDCPADLDPEPMRMVYVRSTDDTVTIGDTLSGSRTAPRFDLSGAGRANTCGQAVAESWQMRVSADGKAFSGQVIAEQADCGGAACSVEFVVRAERAGDHASAEFGALELDPADVAVLSGEVFDGATLLGTAARDGGRVWQLTHDAGVPFLEAIVTRGFKSVEPALGGNNFAIGAVVRDGDRLIAGTWDASAETLAAHGLDLPPGDGFDLWAWDGSTWSALTTDGFGTATREHASALAVVDAAVYVGVTDSVAGAEIWRLGDPPAQVFAAVDGCETGVSDLAVHGGRLHAAITGCPDGVRVLRLDTDEWTPLSLPGFGRPHHVGASLLSTDEQLFALTQSTIGAALFRHVGDRQWAMEAGDGFGEVGARAGGRGLRVHDSDLLIFPTQAADGGAAWLTRGGRALRDLTRFISPGATADALALAITFERRLYLGTRGDDPFEPASFSAAPPARLLRVSALLSDVGDGTLRTARDRAFDGSRGAERACHRQDRYYNPALEHDQAIQVLLPPGVDAEDIVRLPALYLLHPTGDPVAFNADAQAVIGGLASCLYGRRATIPCDDPESDRACLERCITERVPGADAAALADHLGWAETVELPVVERMAIVLAEYGAGIYADAPDAALWTAPDGRRGAWASAVPAVAEYVERCWPLSIRGPEARYVYGVGEGGLAAAAAVGAGVFPAGIAHAPRYDAERLADAELWSTVEVRAGGPLLSIVDADPMTCRGRAAACSVAAGCTPDSAVLQAGADDSLVGRLPAIAEALIWLTRVHRDGNAPAGTCADLTPPDCATLPPLCE